MPYRFNPFTGTLDDIGPAGAGGTVTSVAGGVGITGTPDPIVGAGTLDLDINSLTLETTVSAGDLFAIVDVSVGTAPAAQRKVTLSDVLLGLEALGIDAETLDGLDSTAFQPIDADLTALAALATTGYLVRTGAGTAATRTFQEGANIDLVNADGVAGNTTIAVSPQGTGSGLDADLLDGLDSTAFQPIDADLTAIAALAGTGVLSRTAANTWALTAGTAGRVMFWATGGLVPDDDAALFWDDTNKRLHGSTGFAIGGSADTTTRPVSINAVGTTIDSVRSQLVITPGALSFSAATSIYAGVEAGSTGLTGATWTIDANLLSAFGAGARLFAFIPTIKNTAATARTDMGAWQALFFSPLYRADGAACTVPTIRPFTDSGRSDVINAGTLTVSEWTSVYSEVSIGASVTVSARRGLWYRNRLSTGTQNLSIALEVDDQSGSGTNAAVRSAMASGTGKWFLLSTGTAVSAILGGVRFGSGSAVPDGSSVVHVDGGYTQKRTAATDADYTALLTDCIIEFPAITANRVLNLPTVASAGAGKVYYAVKTTGGFTITIDPNGAELVNGVATLAALGAAATYDTVRIYCTGAAWIASLMV